MSIKSIHKNYKLEAGTGKTNWLSLNYCPLNPLNHSFQYQILGEQPLLTLRIFIDTLKEKKSTNVFFLDCPHSSPSANALSPPNLVCLGPWGQYSELSITF